MSFIDVEKGWVLSFICAQTDFLIFESSATPLSSWCSEPVACGVLGVFLIVFTAHMVTKFDGYNA